MVPLTVLPWSGVAAERVDEALTRMSYVAASAASGHTAVATMTSAVESRLERSRRAALTTSPLRRERLGRGARTQGKVRGGERNGPDPASPYPSRPSCGARRATAYTFASP